MERANLMRRTPGRQPNKTRLDPARQIKPDPKRSKVVTQVKTYVTTKKKRRKSSKIKKSEKTFQKLVNFRINFTKP